jgi:cardiolipin synthase
VAIDQKFLTRDFTLMVPARLSKSIHIQLKFSSARLFSSPRRDHIFNLPNILTMSRIGLTPIIGVCIVQNSLGIGMTLLGVAAFTDWLDGWIARKYNLKTPLGSLLDPAADKILMTTLAVSLAKAGSLPIPLASLIVGRDIFLVGQTLYYRYQTLPYPVLFI